MDSQLIAPFNSWICLAVFLKLQRSRRESGIVGAPVTDGMRELSSEDGTSAHVMIRLGGTFESFLP